jgi:hypothetical protein
VDAWRGEARVVAGAVRCMNPSGKLAWMLRGLAGWLGRSVARCLVYDQYGILGMTNLPPGQVFDLHPTLDVSATFLL